MKPSQLMRKMVTADSDEQPSSDDFAEASSSHAQSQDPSLIEFHQDVMNQTSLSGLKKKYANFNAGKEDPDNMYLLLQSVLSYHGRGWSNAMASTRWKQRAELICFLAMRGANLSYSRHQHLLHYLLSVVKPKDMNNKYFLRLLDHLKSAGLPFDEAPKNNCVEVYFRKIALYYKDHYYDTRNLDSHFIPIITRIDCLSERSLSKFMQTFSAEGPIHKRCWLPTQLKDHCTDFSEESGESSMQKVVVLLSEGQGVSVRQCDAEVQECLVVDSESALAGSSTTSTSSGPPPSAPTMFTSSGSRDDTSGASGSPEYFTETKGIS